MKIQELPPVPMPQWAPLAASFDEHAVPMWCLTEPSQKPRRALVFALFNTGLGTTILGVMWCNLAFAFWLHHGSADLVLTSILLMSAVSLLALAGLFLKRICLIWRAVRQFGGWYRACSAAYAVSQIHSFFEYWARRWEQNPVTTERQVREFGQFPVQSLLESEFHRVRKLVEEVERHRRK